ncbi:MAG TPA: DUF5686 and carboxypeptidase regulatory-like domain-containing protein [Chitinophagaceae bacterium]
MPRYFYPFSILLFIAHPLAAQFYHVTGRITDNKLEPLAFASIHTKETKTGTLSQADGSYDLQLEEGKYDLVISMVGFKNKVVTVIVDKDIHLNLVLDPGESNGLSEVVVKARLKDRAEEFIRNSIRHKAILLAAPGAYSCDIYIRALQKDSFDLKNKETKKDTTARQRLNRELSKLAMAEISLRYDVSATGQTHEERLGVSKRGDPEGLFYLSATEGDFNLYNNLVYSRTLSPMPFISPVSYSGLLAYRFKTLSTVQRNGHKQYSISFRPRQLSNATMEGELVIEDSSWVILSASFRLPRFHLPEYDFFEVSQHYEPVGDTAWMITRQSFTYYSKKGKGKRSGQTIANYHDFVLNKSFPKGYFGNEVSATTQQAYERDSTFWKQNRTEPLSSQEIQFIRYKDSSYNATHTKTYLDSLDRVINKPNWKKIGFLGQELHDHEKERSWELPSIIDLYDPITFGGTRINPGVWYEKTFQSKKTFQGNTSLSYGIRNHDINGHIDVTYMYNPFNRGFFHITAGKEFAEIFAGDAWINQLKRSNVYLDKGIGIGHGLELFNGLFLYSDLNFDYRSSVSDYKTNPEVDSLFGNLLTDNKAIAFPSYNALYSKIRLEYTPGQRYIREPHEKLILGSPWPTFYALWRKGISGVFNSQVNFDYLEFGMQQQIQLGTAGTSSYTLLTGSFPNTHNLGLPDYKYQRRRDPVFFSNPNEAFQVLDSTFPVFKRFYQGHYLHEFNGFFLNKIPLLKKLQLREVAGGGFLVAPERNLRYVEAFTGVERVFKWPFAPMAKFKLGFYVVASEANQFRNPVLFKIGITTWDRALHKWK